MEINVFTEIIREELEKRTGLEVRVQEVTKNNNIILHGICITETLRGDYCFNAEKLSNMINEKQEALKESVSKVKEMKIKLEETKVKRADMERFISNAPNWKEEIENVDVQTEQMLLAAMMERIEVKDGEILIKCRVKF